MGLNSGEARNAGSTPHNPASICSQSITVLDNKKFQVGFLRRSQRVIFVSCLLAGVRCAKQESNCSKQTCPSVPEPQNKRTNVFLCSSVGEPARHITIIVNDAWSLQSSDINIYVSGVKIKPIIY